MRECSYVLLTTRVYTYGSVSGPVGRTSTFYVTTVNDLSTCALYLNLSILSKDITLEISFSL